MVGWETLQSYSRLSALLVGLAAYLGLTGTMLPMLFSRPALYYAPRPIAYHHDELPATAHAYVLLLRPQGPQPALADRDLWLPAGARLGHVVLHDAAACFYPQRVPGGGCGLADLTVTELLR